MLEAMREISETCKPDLDASTLIFLPAEGESLFCSKPARSDLYDILNKQLPAVMVGSARFLIAWGGQWSTDIFEVTKETAPLFEGIVKEYGRRRFKTFAY